MFRKILIPLFLVLLITLGACSPVAVTPTEAPVIPTVPATDEPAPTLEPTTLPVFPLTLTDGLGNTIEITEYPQAIISISASSTEMLFAIGAGGQLVGRDEYSLYPEEALEITNIGALFGELPAETILALEPDLVIAAQIISQDQVKALQDLGLKVYWQANPTDYDGLWKNLRDLALLTGHETETETLIGELEARVQFVQEKIAPVSILPSVFYELDATDSANPWTAGAGTFIDYIITQAGGSNAANELEGDYTQISAEALIAIDPDIILLADAAYGVTPEIVMERPGWNVITAVVEGAVFPIDPNLMSVPGPRLVNALEEVAKLLHPDLFK